MEDPKYSQKCILLKHLRLLFQIQLFHSISRSLLHTPNWTHSHILQYTTPMFVQVQRPHLVYLLNFSSFSWTSTSRGTAISIIKVVLAIYLLPATGSLVHFLQQFQNYACTTSHSSVFQIFIIVSGSLSISLIRDNVYTPFVQVSHSHYLYGLWFPY